MSSRRRRWAAIAVAPIVALALALVSAPPAYAVSTSDLTFDPAPIHGIVPAALQVKGYVRANIQFRVTNRTGKTLAVQLGEESARYTAKKQLEFGGPTIGAAAHVGLSDTALSLSPHQTRTVTVRVDPAVTGDVVVTAAVVPKAGAGVSVIERLGILIQVQHTSSPHSGNSWIAAYVTGGIAALVLLLLLLLLFLRRRGRAHPAPALRVS